ncbi:MAG: hypothetical protein ACREI7_01435 [Myxococcota bacterium]
MTTPSNGPIGNGSFPEPFAPRQTNSGLYVQMHAAGFPPDALRATQRAYRLACRLFNGKYRKTERAFLCHAVGAASSVARFDGRLPYVLAALLHAAYDSGQFQDGRIGGASRRHRAWLVAEIGAEVEAILFRYRRFQFETGQPERYARDGFVEADADLLLLGLCHEVDDLLDLGLRFARKYGDEIDLRVEACAALAERLGKPELAQTLRAHGRLYRDSEWTAELQSATLAGFQIVPGFTGYLRHRYNRLRRRSTILS